MSESGEEQRPAFSVVAGTPTDEELAALVAVLSARAGAAQPEPTPPPTGWSAYWRAVRAPLRPGPDAWRASGRTD